MAFWSLRHPGQCQVGKPLRRLCRAYERHRGESCRQRQRRGRHRQHQLRVYWRRDHNLLSRPPGKSRSLPVGHYTNPYNHDVIIATWDAAGVLKGARRIGGTEDDLATGVAYDASGHLWLSGTFTKIGNNQPHLLVWSSQAQPCLGLRGFPMRQHLRREHYFRRCARKPFLDSLLPRDCRLWNPP